mgnify:CR=1 FL=1
MPRLVPLDPMGTTSSRLQRPRRGSSPVLRPKLTRVLVETAPPNQTCSCCPHGYESGRLTGVEDRPTLLKALSPHVSRVVQRAISMQVAAPGNGGPQPATVPPLVVLDATSGSQVPQPEEGKPLLAVLDAAPGSHVSQPEDGKSRRRLPCLRLRQEAAASRYLQP